jgi:hypothetical protein
MRSFETFLRFPLSTYPFPTTYFNFFSLSFRLNDLNIASLLNAALRSRARHFLINRTGRRLRVYFPPLPDWCDLTLLAKSFVHPV